MIKPSSVERIDFINSMKKMINESKLPLFVIEPILRDMYLQVRDMSARQYEEDLKKYNEQINAEK